MKHTNHDISELKLDIINATGINPGKKVLIKNGVPHVYWLDLYRELGLSQQHAAKLISKLTEAKHFIHLTRLQIRDILDSNNEPLLPKVVAYYFINPEGWNRIITEIETDSMINRDAAKYIDEVKDQMASVFTRYQNGEVISKSSDNVPRLPPLSDALKEEMARADAMTIIGVDRCMAASVCMSKLEDQYNEDLSYLRNLVPRQLSEDIPHLTATQIGKEFSLSPQSVNKILEKEGYQFRTVRMKKTGKRENVWNLEDKGKPFGEIHIERHGGKEIYTILWRRSILEEMKRILFHSDQNTLEGVLA